MSKIDPQLKTELEAAAYRRLIAHLRSRTDVQNIDLMNLAGFCRNCLANWEQEAAAAKGIALSKDEAREEVYGMPYKEWQAKHQTEATAEQKAALAASNPQARRRGEPTGCVRRLPLSPAGARGHTLIGPRH